MAYLYLIVGLAILIFSGDFLVKGGVQIANYLKIPKLIIGLTVISIGTSAPELFVSMGAALNGSSDMSVGNVVGSNIANIGLILGITTLILPMAIAKETSRLNMPILIIISVIFWLLAYDGILSLFDGLVLIVLLVGYIILLIYRAKRNRAEEKEISVQQSIFIALGMVVLAAIGLYFGAELLVNSAQKIARSFGVSERVIGLTILAFGTSVPELATSVMAALKQQMDISVGNIVGSNIFNILSVLGITSIIQEVNVSESILHFDIFVMIGMTLLLLITMIPLKKSYINRWEGGIMLLAYIGYILYLFIA